MRLSDAHKFMIEQHVRGVPLRRIQTTLKRFGEHYSGAHIRKVVATRAGQEYASLVSAQVYGGIAALVAHGATYLPEAVHTQLAIMRSPFVGARHQLAAVQDHLDRFGVPKVSRQDLTNHEPTVVIINLTPQQHASFVSPLPVMEAEVVELPPAQTDDAP